MQPPAHLHNNGFACNGAGYDLLNWLFKLVGSKDRANVRQRGNLGRSGQKGQCLSDCTSYVSHKSCGCPYGNSQFARTGCQGLGSSSRAEARGRHTPHFPPTCCHTAALVSHCNPSLRLRGLCLVHCEPPAVVHGCGCRARGAGGAPPGVARANYRALSCPVRQFRQPARPWAPRGAPGHEPSRRVVSGRR